MSLSLYKIANDYKQVMDNLYDAGFDEQTIKDTLDGLSGNLELKIINTAAFIKNLEAECLAIKSARDELSDRLKTRQNKIDYLKAYLLSAMRDCDIKKINGEQFDVGRRKSQASVDDYDTSLIPDDYFSEEVVRKLDKKLVKQAIDSGYEVPGCRLIEGEYLVIK